jgi:hypothetical protein
MRVSPIGTPTQQIRRKRIEIILQDLNAKGQVHVNEYVGKWLSSRSYVRDLFRTISFGFSDKVQLSEDGDVLMLKERAKSKEGKA